MMEFSLGNSWRLESASHFDKKLPLRCLTELQVRKMGDDIDNKGTSKLKMCIQKLAKHLGRRSFRNRKLFRKKLHHSCLTGL